MKREEVWRYQRGTWSRTTSPIDFEDEDGELLETLPGYSSRTRWFGDEDQFGLEVYSADSDSPSRAPAPYLAVIYNLGDSIERIFVEDLPSLLQLLRETAPILDLPNFNLEPGEEDDEEFE